MLNFNMWLFNMLKFIIWLVHMSILDNWRFVYFGYPSYNPAIFSFANPARVAKRDKSFIDNTVRLLSANVGEAVANVVHRRLPVVGFGHEINQNAKRARW